MRDSTNPKRRNFLLGVGLGSAAAAASVLGARAVRDARWQAEHGGTEAVAQGGYRLTEHVANYYRTTRI